MNLLRPLAGLLLTGLASALSGCLSAPSYPVEPSIDFKEMTVNRYYPPNRQAPVDTFKITLSFKDGDGDLGVTDAEITQLPYSQLNPDKTVNQNQQFNYYLRLFRRVPLSQRFEEVYPKEYFGYYPTLYQGEYKASPLKGDLVFRQLLTLGSPVNAGDEVQFTVSIKDRALHESNPITTSTYVIPKR